MVTAVLIVFIYLLWLRNDANRYRSASLRVHILLVIRHGYTLQHVQQAELGFSAHS